MPYRAALTLVASAAALMLLFSFRTAPSSSLLPAAAAPTATASGAGPTPTATPSGAPPSGGSSPTPSSTATPAARAGGLKDGTFTGQSAANPYGSVQVQLVISGGRITDVKALQYPTAHAQSAYISSIVVPELRAEVLKAQSAQVNLISGATYTSEGYAQSVQSAIDQAHA
jgi:uncharacterized protein with FMN-binding domain